LVLADLGLDPDWNGVSNWFADVKKPKVKNTSKASIKKNATGEGHAA
jgi:hypothetical protein